MTTRRALPFLAAGLVLLAMAAPAAADPLTTAQHRAASLRAQVADLQQRTDTAVETYDEAQDALASAVTTRVRTEQDLERARTAHAAAGDVRTARVRSLYELGGPAALYGTVLRAGSPTEALRGVQVAQRLLGLDAQTARQDAQSGAQLRAAADAAAAAARAQVREAERVDALVGQVRSLLAQQQSLLGAADADVVRIAREQQEEADRQEQLAFAASLEAAQASAGPLQVGPELPPSQRAAAVLAAAKAQLGKPYVWGATGPDSFDCSGLTRWAYAAAGVGLPRTSRQQWGAGPHPPLSDLQPGDLLFWAANPADPSTIHHVAIYAGGGTMVAAPHTGTVVQVQPVYAGGYVGATRIG